MAPLRKLCDVTFYAGAKTLRLIRSRSGIYRRPIPREATLDRRPARLYFVRHDPRTHHPERPNIRLNSGRTFGSALVERGTYTPFLAPD